MIETDTLNLHLNSNEPTFKVAAQYLQSLEKQGHFITRLTDKDFFIYNGKFWQPLEEAALRSMVSQYLQKNGGYSGSLKRAIADIIQAIKDILSINDDFKSKIIQTSTLVNFDNGTLHIDKKNGEATLKKHSCYDYTQGCSSYLFIENMNCPLFDQTLHEIFQNAENPDELVEFVYELIGYILSGIRTYPLFVMLIGGGANGKSLLLRVISNLLGQDAVIHAQIKTFAKDKFNNIGLMGKKAFIDDDMDINFKLNTGMIKKMSEEKEMSARDVYKSKITFITSALPIIAGNDYPLCEDISHGMKRRVCVIPFDHTFEKGDIDPHLFSKIIEAEAEQIIAKSLASLKTRINKGGFYPELPQDIVKANERFFYMADPLSAFMQEETMGLKGSYIKFPELRARLEKWVHENIKKNYSIPYKTLRRKLFSLGYSVDKKVDGYYTVDNRDFTDD